MMKRFRVTDCGWLWAGSRGWAAVFTTSAASCRIAIPTATITGCSSWTTSRRVGKTRRPYGMALVSLWYCLFVDAGQPLLSGPDRAPHSPVENLALR